MGTACARESRVSVGFSKGRRERTGHRKSERWCFTGTPFPYLRASRFQGLGSLTKKENSSRGLLADVSDFVCVTARDPCGVPISVSRFGNIDPTPFRWNTGKTFFFFEQGIAPFQNGALLSLRAD
ncbi:uncharacterized protein LOC121390954 [Gigantopelta aegis]|uniref:uncharacterized protein LOC121390954 n=1 Tax=Gigantopelta aegis TaxID=1735272 RepID=UPI001B88D3D1|nr:uncharacterized protein LOC121390954 [Gigantopelta aegis]